MSEAGQEPLLQNAAIPLILASASRTRAALLREAGLAFTIEAPPIDEASIRASARAEGLAAAEAALLLAEMKARRPSARAPAALVIGADQILVCEGEWFGKPESPEAAARQLALLAGRRHSLVTAVLCMQGGAVVWRHVAEPRLTMRPLGEATIASYLERAGPAVLGSVGAYQAEGLGIRLFEAIEGEHGAILGLPLLPLLRFLRQHGALID